MSRMSRGVVVSVMLLVLWPAAVFGATEDYTPRLQKTLDSMQAVVKIVRLEQLYERRTYNQLMQATLFVTGWDVKVEYGEGFVFEVLNLRVVVGDKGKESIYETIDILAQEIMERKKMVENIGKKRKE